MASPHVTVIIPCYNTGEHLTEAVDSVLENTWKDTEIIVVDDGSTEKTTLDAIRSLERQSKVRIIRRPHKGVAAARNAAAKAATTPYIAFLDGDDLYSKDYLESCLATLQRAQKENQKIGFAYTDVILFGATAGAWVLPEFNLYELLHYNFLPAPSLMRREVWQRAGGFNEGLPNFEDRDFWFSVLEEGWLGVKAHGPMYYYRQHPKQLRTRHTTHRSPREFYRLLAAIRQAHPHLYEQGFMEQARRQWIKTPRDWWRIQFRRLYMSAFPFVPRFVIYLMLRKELERYLRRNPRSWRTFPLEVRRSLGAALERTPDRGKGVLDFLLQ
jgi:glycosyltransferase involved in cell wall biosynthesis